MMNEIINITDFTNATEEEKASFAQFIQDNNAKTKISDVIEVDNELEESMNRLLEINPEKIYIDQIENTYHIPSDLLWHLTLPVPNLKITFVSKYRAEHETELDKMIDKVLSNAVQTTYKEYFVFHIYETEIIRFLRIIGQSTSDEINKMPPMCIGSVTASNLSGFETSGSYILPLFIHPSTNEIMMYKETIQISKTAAKELENLSKMFGKDAAERTLNLTIHMIMRSVGVWYMTQLVLLNPILKYVVNDTGRIPVYSNNPKKNKQNKRPIRYIKRIIINKEKLDDALIPKHITEHSTYTRHTLLWHVAGHWVERNGKRYFRKGHWKGPLASSMKPDTQYDLRERELAINEDIFDIGDNNA